MILSLGPAEIERLEPIRSRVRAEVPPRYGTSRNSASIARASFPGSVPQDADPARGLVSLSTRGRYRHPLDSATIPGPDDASPQERRPGWNLPRIALRKSVRMSGLPVEDLRPWFLAVGDLERELAGARLDWNAWFGNPNPVEIDVGSGRGLFLHTASGANPGTNYVGVEIEFKDGRRAAKRLQRADRTNARVLGGDAHFFLRNLVAPQSVDAIHVYFPDPWWKKKHRSRRVFSDLFVDLAVAALKPRGYLHSWTDVEEYFGVISGLMNNDPRFEALPPPEQRSAEHDMDYQTSFERKARKLGTVIHRGLWRLR